MNVTAFLDILIHIIFISLGVLAIGDYLRHRNGTRRDVALMFGVLALPFLLRLIATIKGEEISAAGQALAILALVLEPYLLLRLVRYLQFTPAYMMRVVGYSLIATIVVGVLAAERLPLLVTIVSQGYLIGFNLYAMFGFVRGALRSTGIQRQRLQFAAAGSGLFALILVAVLASNALPQQREIALLVAELLAAACVITFYISFIPPRWLRHVWQLVELRTYLLQARNSNATAHSRVAEHLLQLCQAAERAVGSMDTAVVQWDGHAALWHIRSETGRSLHSSTALNSLGRIEQLLGDRGSAVLDTSATLIPDHRTLLQRVGADTLIIVPIAANEQTWGVLLVFLRYRSLFIDDDVGLLELLAQQSTMLLDNYRLISELQTYSEQLEQKVEERTVALHQSEKLYRTIARNFPNGSIVLFDTDLRYIVADGMGPAPLGLSNEELAGKTIWEVFPQAYCDEVLEPAYRGILAGNPAPSEIPDNDRIYLLRGVPVRDEHDAIFAGLLITQDITERRRVEDEIRRLNLELEQRVIERTAELETANGELEAFSYSVSHDLRAPLRAIDGFSRILMEDYASGFPSEAHYYFQLVRKNAHHMGQLVDDLLAFSRLSRQPLTTRPVDMAALVRVCLDELHAEQADRHVQISLGDLPYCAGDPALLKQVWMNLLANALKYTSRRDPAVIEITGATHDAELSYRVKDNGVGFDMRYADKLFGVFQRLHRAEDYAGTGVGLAIVQRIIQRHGGRIWADAAPDRGATFSFTMRATVSSGNIT